MNIENEIKILLDIDGVMVTTPAWKSTKILEDGFMKFNSAAAENLAKLISETNASIILTTTHRINYSNEEWKKILSRRGINVSNLSKINDCSSIQYMLDRRTEIMQWIEKKEIKTKFVILDDDSSLNELPANIKTKWVKTSSLIGLDNNAMENVRRVLSGTNCT